MRKVTARLKPFYLGGISTLTLVILLAHIISVSFLPLCLSALNIRTLPDSFANGSSTGASTSVDVVTMSGPPDRKMSPAAPRKDSDEDLIYGIDLERARAAAERRVRARAKEISRQASQRVVQFLYAQWPLLETQEQRGKIVFENAAWVRHWLPQRNKKANFYLFKAYLLLACCSPISFSLSVFLSKLAGRIWDI